MLIIFAQNKILYSRSYNFKPIYMSQSCRRLIDHKLYAMEKRCPVRGQRHVILTSVALLTVLVVA